MKKIVCNVLYAPIIPVFYQRGGMHSHKLGVFVEEKDAFIAAEIFSYAIQNMELFDKPQKVYNVGFEEVIVTEDKTEKRIDFHSLDEYIESDKLINQLIKNVGKKNFKKIVDDAIEKYYYERPQALFDEMQ